MGSDEQVLLSELLCCSSIDEYIERNQHGIVKRDLRAYLRSLIEERCLDKKDVIRRSHIEKVYGYQIFSGKRRPSRDKLIQLCFGMCLGIHQAQELLFIGGVTPLAPRILRDAIILFALGKNQDVFYVDSLLSEWQEKLLQSK